jgi:disulfide bond formation protein DsbB
VTRDVIDALAALAVVGQGMLAVLVVACVLALVGLPGPLAWIRSALSGYELWLAWLVAVIATAGSLFFSEVANFVPCELCWYQRIAMYPLAIVTLIAALYDDYRAARYLLPLPVIGAAVSIYHLLVENGVVTQTQSCLVSAPGGCATRWIDELGYVTIPTLALTAFALIFAFLLFAALDPHAEAAAEDGDGRAVGIAVS